MSTFKVLLISIICGIVLFALIAFLSVAFHRTVSISIIATVFGPMLPALAQQIRKVPDEAKLWRALEVTGFLAPLTWVVVVVFTLVRSDI